MSKSEIVNISGLRVDGRRIHEVRRVRCALGVLQNSDGSAIYEQGNTRVLAVVTGPAERKTGGSGDGKAVANVVCEFSTASFASPERRVRRPGDRRAAESAATLVQCFESVIQRHLYPRSEICIYIQILQSDGGALSAAINAATLALQDAGIAVMDTPVACAVSYVQKTALLGKTNRRTFFFVCPSKCTKRQMK
jgi:exosome complex component RRP41